MYSYASFGYWDLFVCNLYVFVCYLMYPYVTRMLPLCIRMFLVYIRSTRMYPYASVCYSYVTCYVPVPYFSQDHSQLFLIMWRLDMSGMSVAFCSVLTDLKGLWHASAHVQHLDFCSGERFFKIGFWWRNPLLFWIFVQALSAFHFCLLSSPVNDLPFPDIS